MATINVSAKDYQKVFQANERARVQRVKGAMVEAAALGAEIVAGRVPVDQGQLKASVHATPSPPEIIANAPHAAIIENGARPHWPPIAPLVEWIERHRIDLGIEDDSDVVGLAHAIAAKIAEEGAEPHWFMRGSLDDLRKILKEIVERRIRD